MFKLQIDDVHWLFVDGVLRSSGCQWNRVYTATVTATSSLALFAENTHVSNILTHCACVICVCNERERERGDEIKKMRKSKFNRQEHEKRNLKTLMRIMLMIQLK